jgi:formate dehydrogenase iron-sulfur subunit
LCRIFLLSLFHLKVHSTNQRRHTYVRDNVEVGFFTDPTVCIGCKACEVACKEWNHVPDDGFVWSGNSYDNTGHLGASTWRRVMFVEQDRQKGRQIVGSHSLGVTNEEDPFRWIFLSDVCKHCEQAGCLEACPTGAIVRTEVASGACAERHLQRLRLLRRLVPIWRD